MGGIKALSGNFDAEFLDEFGGDFSKNFNGEFFLPHNAHVAFECAFAKADVISACVECVLCQEAGFEVEKVDLLRILDIYHRLLGCLLLRT